MRNFIKKHKFCVGIIVLLVAGFAVEKLSGAETIYTAIYIVAGVTIVTWILFNVKRLFSRLGKSKTKEA